MYSLEDVVRLINNWSMIQLTSKEIKDWADKNL